MSLLDFLRPQGAQAPGAMSQPSGLSQMMQPEVLAAMAGQLLGNQGNAANFGNAFGAAAPVLARQKELQAQTAQDNKTYEFFKTKAPEYAQMIDAGMPVSMAWQEYNQARTAKPTRNEYEERSAAAQQYGLQGEDATSFVLTGQLPTGRFGSAEVGLQPIPVYDDKGGVRFFQPTKAGPPVEMQFPEGYRPMSPFDKANQTATGRTIGEGAGAAMVAMPGAQRAAQKIQSQVEELKTDPYLPNMLGPIDSRKPNITEDAARVKSRIAQLSGDAFLSARQALKGGGAITDMEGQRAEAALVRMNEAQSVEDFNKALDEFNYHVQLGMHILQQQAAMGATGEQSAPQGGSVDYKTKYGLD